ncbi:amidohydrolase [Zobellia barbeyronii]|uniref:Amidohydrolase n=1 Tax=Zobellia barbeyronii TaxID=2748009 RepID=A0ABS5W9J3_9FLAO|nr:amidohydrolase [Zobellia barbeyronii]MBT2160052.1 amidohydrolase [Zobellia barbeyronii]
MDELLNVALVQTSLAWEDPKANREELDTKLEALTSDIDLIVLPEMFTTGFTMSPRNIEKEEGQRTLAWMQQKAKEKDVAMVGSIVFFENDAYTNRLLFVEPDGKTSIYDKRHTFTLAGEDKVYQAGKERLIVNYKGFKICPMICYDLRFPVWARNTEDYDVLIYVANWPEPRITAWDTLLKARAIENMTYCIGVNRIGSDEVGHKYPGHSVVFDGLGKELEFSVKEEIVTTSLSKKHIHEVRNKLKFLNDRDRFTLE